MPKDKKDDIIALQLDLIRSMTEHNLRNVSDDLWGASGNKNTINSTPQNNNPNKNNAKIQSSNKACEKANPNNPPTATSSGAPKVPTPEQKEEPKIPIADLKKELDSYIGLDKVKEEVKDLINIAAVYKMRQQHNLPNVDMSFHMVFMGNPGTGKTMIARLMAKVYRSLDIISKGHLVEVDRSGLVAGYVGQTALKTSKVIESAVGGVLFIDEAYTLTSKSENDFGFEAVDTILKAMEDKRDDLIVIVAGYDELMEEFIESNPGLRSRFNKYLHFEDYTVDEMMKIFELQCKKSQYKLDKDAEESLRAYLTIESVDAGTFGNARGVRNIFEKILTEQANRLASMEKVTAEDLMRITDEDVRRAAFGDEIVDAEIAEKKSASENKDTKNTNDGDKNNGDTPDKNLNK